MRILLAVTLALTVACDTAAPGGQLGLPSVRAATPTRAPTASPRPVATASPSATASASATPSASPSGTPAGSATATTRPSAPPTSTPAPTPTPDQRPDLASASGTQVTLTIVFSRPMKTVQACGTTGRPAGATGAGAIDDLGAGELAAHLRSADDALQESLSSATQVSVSGDCTTFTFVFGLAAPAGQWTLEVRSVVSRDGAPLGNGTAGLAIADEGRPVVADVASRADVLTVTYTEPMLRIGEGGGVAMLTNYRLDGNTPAASEIVCVDAGCRTVRLTLRPGTLVPGRAYELRIANVVDRSGRNIAPDPTTRSFVAGY